MAGVNTVKQIESVLMPSALTYSAVTRRSDTALVRWLGRWYLTAMAVAMIVVAVAGFAPSLFDPSRRLAPLTPLVAVHGILVLCWLLLFVFQTALIGSRHVAFHRRMGIVAVVLLTLLVPLSYVVTMQMIRRGFDLSGDQGGKTDPLFASIFNFVALIEFLVLAGGALVYRHRKEIHKRFMLFANIPLMGAPITHFLGHFDLLSLFTVLGGLSTVFLVCGSRGLLPPRARSSTYGSARDPPVSVSARSGHHRRQHGLAPFRRLARTPVTAHCRYRS
jgi:hypothetical protein